MAVSAAGGDDGGNNCGYVYTVFLNADGSAKRLVKIANENNSDLILTAGDVLGTSVAALGDVDGDGVVDLAVGAPGTDTGATDAGAVYILFMKSDGTVKRSQKIGHQTGGGPSLTADDAFGQAVVGAGDFDGDGVRDLAVGAPRDNTGGTDRGAVYLLYLNSNGTVKSSRKIANQTSGGPTLVNSDYFGSSLAAAGDLDLDLVPDLLVGANGDDTGGTDRGAVHMLFLNADGSVKSVTKIAHQQNGGPTLVNSDRFGTSVARIGDVNQDGGTDLAVGADWDDTGGTNRGAVYVLFLSPPPTLTVSLADSSIAEHGGTTTGTVTRSHTGTSQALTVNLTSSDTSEATVPAQVTILAGQVSATFTVSGVDDSIIDGTQTVTLTASSAGHVSGGAILSVTDDDANSIVVNPVSGLVTTEAGGAAAFTVVLSNQPAADVTVAVHSGNVQEGTASPGSLTFTSANWNQPQTVTVTGVDDAVDDGDIAYTIITAAAVSSDANYNGVNPADVSVTNLDNDTAGITVNPTSGLVDDRGGRHGDLHDRAEHPADGQRDDRL